MSKELEALRQLVRYSASFACLDNGQAYEDKRIIESALEVLDIIKTFKISTVIENERYLLLISNVAYDITKEQYDIVNKYLEESK